MKKEMETAERKVKSKRRRREVRIDAGGLSYRELNERVCRELAAGAGRIVLQRVNGQRYLGVGVSGNATLVVRGTPGNDLAAFMDGLTVVVKGNGQDGIGNTMSSGKVIVHGSAGDIVGHSMRGGEIYLRGEAGYRAGIHMKSYREFYPVIVVGGRAGNFLGEYMAGGLIVVLGLDRRPGVPVVGKYCGTGMHGGKMYVRGGVEEHQLGKEVKTFALDREDRRLLKKYLREFGRHFGLDPEPILRKRFVKLLPSTHRPYGKLYAY